MSRDKSQAELDDRRDKRRLDEETPFFTFLPQMAQGHNPGYHDESGVVAAAGANPRDWLEVVGKYMLTPGEDVGYSIPDVLACEQQTQRMIDMPPEEAEENAELHDQILTWRAMLAILLLWDAWEDAGQMPKLELCDFFSDTSMKKARGFQQSIRRSVTPERLRQGLKIFVLSRERDEVPVTCPLCMLSPSTIIVPAADAGGLSDLLPPQCAMWYEKKGGSYRFKDLSPLLTDRDRTRLIAKLRLLKLLNERRELHSSLYMEGARLVGWLDRFIADLLEQRRIWQNKIKNADQQTLDEEMYPRLAIVLGLFRDKKEGVIRSLKREVNYLTVSDLCADCVLLRQFIPADGCLDDDLMEPIRQVIYLYRKIPFAKESEQFLLEPVNHPEERAAIDALQNELNMMQTYSSRWNLELGEKLSEAAARLSAVAGTPPTLIKALKGWADHHLFDFTANAVIELKYPLNSQPEMLQNLMGDFLNVDSRDMELIYNVFSDKLLLIKDALRPPFADQATNGCCRVTDADGAQTTFYAVPPLSMKMAAWLTDHAVSGREDVPRFIASSLRFVMEAADGCYTVHASYEVNRVQRTRKAATSSTVRFSRDYYYRPGQRRDASDVGDVNILEMDAAELPYVAVWPNVNLSAGLWKQYYVYAHQPGALSVWAYRHYDEHEWSQGTFRHIADFEASGVRESVREWQVVPANTFPMFVGLKKGLASVGVLFNGTERRQFHHGDRAVIGVDMGSTATTVMMRQGAKISSVVYPYALHKELLDPGADGGRYLGDELIPKNALCDPAADDNAARGSRVYERACTFYSAMDMFTDDYTSWRSVLEDGHIFFPENLDALALKNENTLYYNIKWGEEKYRMYYMTLFIKQTMLQAVLAARLTGAPSVAFRVSIPNSMPEKMRADYLMNAREVALMVSQSTGVPLTEGEAPLSYATENQADGMFFRSRNEASVRNGYINLDVGGGTTDISVWLNNAVTATLESSLRLGTAQILFDSVVRSPMRFSDDFEGLPDDAARALDVVMKRMGSSLQQNQRVKKSMFLLDDFLADYGETAFEYLRGNAKTSYTASLAAFNFSFLFYIAGSLLESVFEAGQDTEYLHEKIEICLAGNGGRLLYALSDEKIQRAVAFALLPLKEENPVKKIFLVRSAMPKAEVAIGLLAPGLPLRTDENEDAAKSAQVERRLPSGGGETMDYTPYLNYMLTFLRRFRESFPDEAELLLSDLFAPDEKGACIRQEHEMELRTVVDNEFLLETPDIYMSYARCFAALKQRWKI